jgi:hypothetical protein
MLLETNGTVLVHNEPSSGGTGAWYKLTPDSTGSYINGTWKQIASLPSGYAPLYFASAILPDGRMIVEGGEYNGTNPNPAETNLGAIYTPSTNTWKAVAPPAGWTMIGDAQSDLLPSGTFMMAQITSGADALFNASTLSWKQIPGTGKHDANTEETWTLEPSNQLLAVDVSAPPATELFTGGTALHWGSAGNTVGTPVNAAAFEIGPQVEMPGGNTFVVGGGTNRPAPTACTTTAKAATALYHYQAGTVGTWTAGPAIPTFGGLQYDAADGPGSILPNGNVLFDVSKCVYYSPTHFFVYSPTANTLTQVADTPNAPNDSTYYTRMLALPNGQVLFDDGTQMEVYTAGGVPKAAWQPSITSLSSASLAPGGTYSLSGRQLAGLDQGATYGDDAQNNTNFPLVRITNSSTGTVTYATTSSCTSVGVTPGLGSSTKFTLPSTTPAGASTLVVVANGIASAPASATVT